MTNPYTKGPWRLDDSIHAHVITSEYHTIEAGNGFYDVNEGGGNGFSIAAFMTLSDAHLISAAPDMAEALEAFVEFAVSEIIEEGCRGKSDPGCPSCMAIKVVDRARSALAKARGQS